MADGPGLHRMTRPLPSPRVTGMQQLRNRVEEGNSRGRAAANRQEKTPNVEDAGVLVKSCRDMHSTKFGSPGRIRTGDLSINSRMLYR